MRSVDAGTLDRKPVVFPVTVHGTVRGTATVGGRPYAIARVRSTYGRDGESLAALRDMTVGRGSSVEGFWKPANEFGFTFNWASASRRHVAYFSSGRLPRRAPGTNKLLPTLGTGAYDWRGFIPLARHPHDADPRRGLFLNWNGKSAPGWEQGDDVHTCGAVQRVEMFDGFPRRVRLQDVASIMNRAATEDLRATELWPVIRAVLSTGPAPDPRTAEAAALITAWSRRGGPRLDLTGDGRVDDPGAAITDAAWAGMGDAVLRPVLGPLTDGFARDVQRRDESPAGAGTEPRGVASRCHERADQVPARAHRRHDALDEPADVPAGPALRALGKHAVKRR
jgi:Penicillin amidase